MVVTDNDELATKMRSFQNACAWPSAGLIAQYLIELVAYHLMTAPQIHWYSSKLYSLVGRRNPLPGATSAVERRGGRPPDYQKRLSNAQAALGLRQLARLGDNVSHRHRISAEYGALLSHTAFHPPSAPPRAEHAPFDFQFWYGTGTTLSTN